MCMATDREQGMIEVVTQAQTLAQIQNKKAFDRKLLYEWLKAKNPTK